MYKFEIEYAVVRGDARTRKAKVYAEDLDEAVHKIAAADGEYSHSLNVKFYELERAPKLE